ncbi:MAG: DUF4398 and OmpA-like domain-containing protein [Rubrivivax sp.]|nr:DUF4398 and OmpA-like domain-containing protein [Rubrivivax sp.]
MKYRFFLLPAALAALAAVGNIVGCSTVPERNFALDQARLRLGAAQADPQVTLHAGEELRLADAAVQAAGQAHLDRKTTDEVDHLAYVGERRVVIARETAEGRAAQAVVAGAGAERDRMLVAQREQEAQAVRRQLASSQLQGQRQSADLAQADRDAAAARAGADRDAAAARAQAERDAAQGKAQLARSDARADSLELQLKAMDARRTERGIVVTLGDMLFDSGKSKLQTGGASSIAKLAEFMKDQPQRRAVIEGYTDDVGQPADNQALSDRRARSVMSALVGMGVGAERLSTFGHGSSNPAAGNDTAAGRQANRRVEIVFAPDAPRLP